MQWREPGNSVYSILPKTVPGSVLSAVLNCTFQGYTGVIWFEKLVFHAGRLAKG